MAWGWLGMGLYLSVYLTLACDLQLAPTLLLAGGLLALRRVRGLARLAEACLLWMGLLIIGFQGWWDASDLQHSPPEGTQVARDLARVERGQERLPENSYFLLAGPLTLQWSRARRDKSGDVLVPVVSRHHRPHQSPRLWLRKHERGTRDEIRYRLVAEGMGSGVAWEAEDGQGLPLPTKVVLTGWAMFGLGLVLWTPHWRARLGQTPEIQRSTN